MPTAKISKPKEPEAITPYKAGRLLAERERLEDERLEHDKHSRSLKKQFDAIDGELYRFVDANASPKDRTVSVGKWKLAIVQVAGSFSALTELVRQIGQEAVDRLKAAVPTKDRLEVRKK